ncbi:MAG: RNA-directed DNA polymerase, partial [Bacteroidales bacterium]|nr:RNA-directed DNA polymerase [Bacteroidales bacterium]
QCIMHNRHPTFLIPMYLSPTQLLIDLHTAYLDARRHKRSRPYPQDFEKDMAVNLREMADMLYNRQYQPGRSICFVIEDPKKREVFAADFRDRIVHHLYYNYTHELFERTFIADSYSCIKKRGTHYGISRLQKYIRQESLNYTEHCHILKMDISGYFMHIDRNILLSIVLKKLAKMRHHKISVNGKEKWDDVLDFDFIRYLSQIIITLNPTTNCIFRGSRSDWDSLPYNRSLFNSPDGCGLPIGNLTSQLFSNVYLGEFDDYIKRTLKVRRYGRYVDDFYIVSNDKDYLLSLIPKIEDFLSRRLHLSVNTGKTQICDSHRGVGFLGAYLKPFRRYIHNDSLTHIMSKIPRLSRIHDPEQMRSIVSSYLGVLSHCASYHIRRRIFLPLNHVWRFGYFDKWFTHFYLR